MRQTHDYLEKLDGQIPRKKGRRKEARKFVHVIIDGWSVRRRITMPRLKKERMEEVMDICRGSLLLPRAFCQ